MSESAERGRFGRTEPNEYLIGVWGGRELRLTTMDEQAKIFNEQPRREFWTTG
jgi:hypothetical protein